MDEIELKRADTNDADELADILTRATQRKISYKDFSWGDKLYSTNEASSIIDSGLTFFCYFKDELMGAVSIRWSDDKSWPGEPVQAGYIHKLAVKKEYSGFGAKILDQIEGIISANNCHVARLDCEEKNKSLCQYYELQGYQLVATFQQPGSNYTAALFEKRLS